MIGTGACEVFACVGFGFVASVGLSALWELIRRR